MLSITHSASVRNDAFLFPHCQLRLTPAGPRGHKVDLDRIAKRLLNAREFAKVNQRA